MPTIISNRPQTQEHHGKLCHVVRSLTLELDGEAFDVAMAKSLVELEDTSRVVVQNIELQF
jgi:hypothetical protein